MEALLKKANTIKKLGIAGIILVPVAILLFIISLFFWPLIYVGAVVIVAGGPICLAAAIMILATDWQNQEINDCKLLWGLLGLLLIPAIAPIVFGNKAIKILSNNTSNNASVPSTTTAAIVEGNTNTNVSSTSSTINNINSQTYDKSVADKIEKIKTLYQEELLTESEANAKISKIITEASIGE